MREFVKRLICLEENIKKKKKNRNNIIYTRVEHASVVVIMVNKSYIRVVCIVRLGVYTIILLLYYTFTTVCECTTTIEYTLYAVGKQWSRTRKRYLRVPLYQRMRG